MLPAIVLLFTFGVSSPAQWLQSDNYPNPYKGVLSQKSIKQNVSDGYGTAILFNEFLTYSGGCVFGFSAITSASLCADAMDLPSAKKILKTNGTGEFEIKSTQSSDGLFHAGISGKVVIYNLSDPSFFKCGDIIDLTTESPFFLVSQNYPDTPTNNDECTVTFTSDGGIRFAVYDITSDLANDYFIVSGDSYEYGMQNKSIGGNSFARSGPYGMYFKEKAIVRFQLTPSPVMQKGFYIIVHAYNYTTERQSQFCANAVNMTVGVSDADPIGIFYGKSQPYLPYTKCYSVFNAPPGDTMLLFNLIFESEKCCDSMVVHGFNEYPYDEDIYSGFHGNNWIIAKNRAVTMDFEADGVVGGVGFSGTVGAINCSCGTSTMSISGDKATLSFPSNAMTNHATYCPNSNCTWQINLPINYDLSLFFQRLSLRTPQSGLDRFLITDRYGSTLKQTVSGTTVEEPYPRQMSVSSGPLQISFTSAPSTIFLDSQMGNGFSIDFSAKEKKLERTVIDFTANSNSSHFVDLVNMNFAGFYSTTYEYLVKALPDKKVYFYMFTPVMKNAHIDIFDGADTSAPMINTSIFINEFAAEGVPAYIVSSGPNLLIQARANVDYSWTGQDFQAMVTDYNASDCGPIVYTLTKNTNFMATLPAGKSCMTILHVTDSSYDSSLALSLSIPTNSSLYVFKGLGTSDDHRLADPVSHIIPPLIYDRYITLLYNLDNPVAFSYSWKYATLLTTYSLADDDVYELMSQDFLPYLPAQDTRQEFMIQSIGSGHEQRGIQLTFLRPTGAGSGTMELRNPSGTVWTKSFNSNTKSVVGCGTTLILNYTAPASNSSGMFIKYNKGPSYPCVEKIGHRIPAFLLVYFMAVFG